MNMVSLLIIGLILPYDKVAVAKLACGGCARAAAGELQPVLGRDYRLGGGPGVGHLALEARDARDGELVNPNRTLSESKGLWQVPGAFFMRRGACSVVERPAIKSPPAFPRGFYHARGCRIACGSDTNVMSARLSALVLVLLVLLALRPLVLTLRGLRDGHLFRTASAATTA